MLSLNPVGEGGGSFRLYTIELPGGGLPIALAEAQSGGVWVTGEFSNTLHWVGTHPVPAATAIEVPIRAQSGHYPYLDGEGRRSRRPQSENVITDSRGRVWFAQLGHWANLSLPEGAQNYSRIVSYQPETGDFCVYPVPDSNAAVMGVAWDEARNLIWFSQSGNNSLVAFNPDELRACDSYTYYSWHFNQDGKPARPLPIAYCERPVQGACMRKYQLEGPRGLLNQLIVKQPGEPDAGSIWFTELMGGNIGRFDPDSGALQRFSVDSGDFPKARVPAAFFPRVHNILTHPRDGDLVYSANAWGVVQRFDIQRYLADPGSCTAGASGGSPCVKAFQLPVYDPATGNPTTHSLAFDGFANLWVSTWTGDCPLDTEPPGLAVIDADWQQMQFWSQRELFAHAPAEIPAADSELYTVPCDENGWPVWAFKGIVVDREQNVWFTNYYQRLVHKIEFLR